MTDSGAGIRIQLGAQPATDSDGYGLPLRALAFNSKLPLFTPLLNRQSPPPSHPALASRPTYPYLPPPNQFSARQ